MKWDPVLYDARHSFAWRHGADLIRLLAPRRGERILDLGCGTGHLAYRIEESGAHVVGIDASRRMIQIARRNFPGIQFQVADATSFRFREPFDGIFSNAVLHWIARPAKAVDCVWRALRPDGRFVAEFGGKGNVRRITDAILTARRDAGLSASARISPWYFPSVGDFASLLEKRGFDVISAELFPRPTRLEGGTSGLRNWLRMFAGDFFADLPRGKRRKLTEAIEEHLRPDHFRGRTWYADYVRIRVKATRPTVADM